MSERKGINKYYPPDWDPSKVPKRQKIGNQDIKVRLMAPFSMRCLKCNEYIAERRKFNAKKEITKEMYMNFKIIRFHITCPRCNNKITFKTSPQTAGYVTETGAVRNHQPKSAIHKEEEATPKDSKPETEDEILERLEREEQENQSYQVLKDKRKRNPFWQKQDGLKDGDGNVMENLEKRLLQQQRENEINDHLEQLHARQVHINEHGGNEQMINSAQRMINSDLSTREEQDELADEDAAQRAFAKFRSEKKQTVEKIEIESSEDEDKEESEKEEEIADEEDEVVQPSKRETSKAAASTAFNPKIVLKRKKDVPVKTAVDVAPTKALDIGPTALSTLAGYSSDETE
ncbi:splicing factor Yju2p [[Candida] railenensis]|uniref:Splicing factor YJU2 n=1 Tax=[Candida] railenensis TaxID=45579 RepID=A0A9P0QXD3_9ASCO|nr:splicing factor Yju2p [[Candida] railenensis]